MMRTILLLSTLLSCLHNDVDAKRRAAASCCGSRRLSEVVERRAISRIPWAGSVASSLSSSSASLLVVERLPRGGQRGTYDYDDEDDYYNSRSNNQQQGGYPQDDRYSDPRQGHNDDYYNEDRGYYDDRGTPPGRDGGGMSRFQVPDIIKTGNRKIGLPLLGIGGVLTVLGISLFFNKTLMRLGNLFFVAGVPMTIGPGRTAGYFFQPKKARATGCLASGIFLVFVGWPVLGIVLEVFGLLNLFGNMFPVAMMMLKSMPVIGPMLRGQGSSSSSGGGRRGSDRYSAEDDDDYYGGGSGGYDRGYYDDGGDPDDRNQGYY